MTTPVDIAIVSRACTPMGCCCGALRDFTANELAAVASQEAIRRGGLEAREFGHAVFDNAMQTSGDALYGALHVALRAGHRHDRGKPAALSQPQQANNWLVGAPADAWCPTFARFWLTWGSSTGAQVPHLQLWQMWGTVRKSHKL
jgi:hypothetical protein